MTIPIQQGWPWWRWIITALSALGLALSAYLSWHHLMGGSVIGCGGGTSCDQVLSSRWSAVGRVLPVSGLAAGAYLAMLMASFFIGPRTAAPDRRLAWGAMLLLAGAVVGSAVWFTIVQKWIVGAFCPYCMVTHITGVLLAALIIWRAFKQFNENSAKVALPNPVPEPVTPQRVTGTWPAIALPVFGLALAGILVASQVAITPPAVYRAGTSEGPVNTLPVLNPRAVPLIGSPDAPYVVNMFFDYKCPHCRQMHAMLDEAIRRYDGKLAFALCPAPLNTQCNPHVGQNVELFKDSCELTKIGLAVWVANREAFVSFDQWMFSPDSVAGGGDGLWHPRSLDAAWAKAVELVGQAKFDAARADPWIERYMQISIQLYGDTILQSGNAVPKLTFGARWVTPQLEDVDELVLILQKSLAVPKPQ